MTPRTTMIPIDAAPTGARPHAPRSRTERAAGWLAAATLVLLLWPLVSGSAGPVGDATLFHMPYQMLVGDFARAGELLLWNPWTNGGSPDGAEPQIGALSPLAVAIGWLGGGTSASFVWFWIATWCLSAVGMARLVQHLGAPGWAQYGLALAWCTNGAFVGHAGHTCFMHVFALLPFAVWCLDRALSAASTREFARLAACAGGWWGLSGLAGYPGLVVVSAMVLAGWCLVRLIPPVRGESPATSVPRAAGGLVILVVAGLAVLAPSYAAFFAEGSGFSGRTGALSREIATGWNAEDPAAANPLEPLALFSLASPVVAPAAAHGPASDPFAITDPSSVGANAGLAVWVLAAIALVGARRSRRNTALFALGLLSLGLALGHALPLRAWAYDLLPPLRYFRHSAFFRVGLLFALTVLAARGASRIDARAVRRSALAVATVAGAATAAALVVLPELTASTPVLLFAVPPFATLAVAFAAGANRRRATGALTLLTAGGAAFALLVGRPLVMEDAQRRDALDAHHVGLVDAVDDDVAQTGFERDPFAFTIAPERTAALLAGDTAALAEDFANPVGTLFDSANLPGKENVLAGYTALNNRRHHQLAAFPALLDQALGRERVFFAAAALQLPDDDATFEAFTAAAAGGDVPLVVHDADAPPTELGADAAELVATARLDRVPFAVEQFEPRVLELELLRPPATDGWILVTERWAAGWSATVTGPDGDAAPAAVHRAGFLWRAVEVPAGARTVRFTYRPFGWPGLLILSWGVLVGLLAWSLVARARSVAPDATEGAILEP